MSRVEQSSSRWSGKGLRRRSPWLKSTLSELDDRIKAMLELIKEDADSFAKCAEIYYRRRPQLINMVEELRKAHRSLAERYYQLILRNPTEKSHNSPSDSFEANDSEIDDPEDEDEADSTSRATLEMKRLKEENRVLRAELQTKDEEKRKVIRQLTKSICMLKQENTRLKNCIKKSKNWGFFGLKKLQSIFSGNLAGN